MRSQENAGAFTGKVAVVTGAGSGIGAASARRLSGDGARVVAVDSDGAAVEEVVRTLPGEAVAVRADISREEDVEHYIGAAREAFGRTDLHHLNAGVFGTFDRLPDVTADDFDRVLAVNLRGTFLGLRAAFRRYEEQDSGGAVVVTASIASLRGSDDLIAYQASKHGALGLVHGAALYGGPRGVRVNAVAPGLVHTRLFSSGGGAAGGGGDMEQRGTTTPMRRVGTAEEIAGVTAFLLSDDAAYVTGEVVSADGGASVVNTVRPSGGAGAWTPGGTG
ncbi:SDR family oxidoreductase [Streptomyces bathyalis]|uniref:SDR family oxidoreductase n=1 Tax=Streptomyces bathyalis TaxID=2710756 RepID=A0A7T1WU74_9ACTN|nr:SDR family oxidoreductase [Streptomyces bathyalis]QPP09356.1 SDR family oxidoreductase [Streptomyces bathyalis]